MVRTAIPVSPFEPEVEAQMGALSEISGTPSPEDTRSLLKRVEQTVHDHPDALALICAHQSPGLYGLGIHRDGNSGIAAAHARLEFYRGVKQVAAALESLGFKDGCPLFVILGNSVEHVLTTWGGYKAGSEARHMVKTALDFLDAPAAAVVVKNQIMANQWDELFPDLDCVKIAVEEPTDSWMSFGTLMTSTTSKSAASLNSHITEGKHPETSMFFTSGTTSMPKTCVPDLCAWTTALETRSTLAAGSVGNKVVALIPSSHAIGHIGMVLSLTRGAALVYTSYLGFNPEVTMETLRREECTYLVMGAFLSTGGVETPDTITKDGHIAVGIPTWGGTARFHYSGYQTVKRYLGIDSKDFYQDKDIRSTGDQAALNTQAVPLPDPVAGEVPAIVVNRNIDHSVVRKIIDTVLENIGQMYAPSKVLSIETLGKQDYPRTSSGKTLAAADPGILPSGSSSIGDKVAYVWASTLGLLSTELDLHADLSERSNSITLMRVHAKVRRETGREVLFAAWSSVGTVAEQMKLFDHAPAMGGKKSVPAAKTRQGGPRAEDMAHLAADPSRFGATQDLISKAITPCQLSWDDIEDLIPTTDRVDLLTRSHVFDYQNVHISVLTRNVDCQRLHSALEAALSNHTMLLSFMAINETLSVADRALHVTIRPTRKIFDQCVLDYGVLETVEDAYKIQRDWPQGHEIPMPGPLGRFLIAFVKETNSAVMIENISHAITDPHIPFKAWADALYNLQYSPAAQPALDYHAGQMPHLTGLYSDAVDAVMFNWTGANTF
ncbi:acetyl-CoA synthetase-like protein [Aspergillus ellipticus CBS 707.79]|uniref:Acetyl-CoA synthetase-like protein n=1 Tax=Aspergillus ellipticus CBS 707.79 TaxID=1448320 RepID=A0A319DIX2_9EURO|nr:acetyl-CoA synthetase-like protein [Aspergillus ellipticus CBS 707.79]